MRPDEELTLFAKEKKKQKHKNYIQLIALNIS